MILSSTFSYLFLPMGHSQCASPDALFSAALVTIIALNVYHIFVMKTCCVLGINVMR